MGNNLRTTLALLFASVSISLYAYYFEQESPDWEPKPYFTQLVGRDIVEIELVPGPAALAEKKGEPVRILLKHQRATENDLPRWHIVEPYAFEVFYPRVEGILRALIELRKVSPVSRDEIATSFQARSTMEIRFKTRDGRESRIEIGPEHPIETMDLLSVRVDGAEAFHTVGKFKRSLDVRLESLRSRALVPVPAEKMIRVEVRYPGEETGFTVERRVGSVEWRFLAPHVGVVDPDLIEELLNNLNSWRIETFVADAVDNLDDYGFSEPRMLVSITERRGDGVGRVFQYEVADDPGDRLGEDEVYVRDPRRSFLYSTGTDVIVELEQPVEELRNRFLLNLGASRIVELNGVVQRSAGGENTPRRFRLWKAETSELIPRPGSPINPGEFAAWKVHDAHLQSSGQVYKADPSVTSGVVMALSRFPITRYMDDASDPIVSDAREGRLPIALEIRIKTETTLERTLRFFKAPEDRDFSDESYLVTRDGTDEIVLVNTLLPLDLAPGGIYFRDRNVSGIDALSVRSFEVWNSTGGVWSLGRIGDAWRVGESDNVRMMPGKGLDETLVYSLVRALSEGYFRVEGFLPDAKDEEQLEIVPGRWRGSIYLRDVAHHEGFRRIIIGARRERSPGQEYYGKLDSIPEMPVLLTNDLVRRFIELIDHLEAITENP